MKRILKAALFFSSLALVACGGGGGSSSGGGGDATQYAGTYSGSGTINILRSGRRIAGNTGGVIFVIRPTGEILYQEPSGAALGGAILNGNKFSIKVSASVLNQPGLRCSGKIIYTGSVSGRSLSGNISSNAFSCNGKPLTATGSFKAGKTSRAARESLLSLLGDSLAG